MTIAILNCHVITLTICETIELEKKMLSSAIDQFQLTFQTNVYLPSILVKECNIQYYFSCYHKYNLNSIDIVLW